MSQLTLTALGPYRLLSLLGVGGMSEVYRAHDPRLDREVAIKVLSSELARQPGFLERFRREARAAARLDHPSIMPVFDFGEEGGIAYVVMPLVEGGTLRDRLAQRGTCSLREAGAILYQVALALHEAHRHGLVHRDVKPANILLTPAGRAILADFGIACALADRQDMGLTKMGIGIGTPEYMAPEQACGNVIDHRADVYALGILLFQVLTGRVPFSDGDAFTIAYRQVHEPPPPPRRLNPTIPLAIEEVILKALAKDPTGRFQTAAEFAGALAEGAAWLGLPGSLAQLSGPQPIPPRPRPAPAIPQPAGRWRYEEPPQDHPSRRGADATESHPRTTPADGAPTLRRATPGLPRRGPPTRQAAPAAPAREERSAGWQAWPAPVDSDSLTVAGGTWSGGGHATGTGAPTGTGRPPTSAPSHPPRGRHRWAGMVVLLLVLALLGGAVSALGGLHTQPHLALSVPTPTLAATQPPQATATPVPTTVYMADFFVLAQADLLPGDQLGERMGVPNAEYAGREGSHGTLYQGGAATQFGRAFGTAVMIHTHQGALRFVALVDRFQTFQGAQQYFQAEGTPLSQATPVPVGEQGLAGLVVGEGDQASYRLIARDRNIVVTLASAPTITPLAFESYFLPLAQQMIERGEQCRFTLKLTLVPGSPKTCAP